jgi:dTDP-4-amino-4,6-dideoxygalactose transaminase
MPSAEELLPYLRRIDEGRWYTNFGPLVKELEALLRDNLAATQPVHVRSVANCTLGLELALGALSLPRAARVLVPALTFVATAMAVRRAGFQPVFGDVDERSWLLTPEIARHVASSVPFDCVMPVAAFGCPADTDAWDEFSRQTGIPVVIDAAAAFGNQRVGSLCSAVFSLHATKSLGAGEGGFIATPDAGVAERFARMSNFGIDETTGYSTLFGTNAKLSEYHAAVGLAALERWRARRSSRVAMANAYAQEVMASCSGVTLQQRPADGVYTLFPVCLPPGCDAASAGRSFAGENIETRRWYVPLASDHPSLERPVVADLSTSERLKQRLLGLPMYPGMSAQERARVTATLSTVCAGIGAPPFASTRKTSAA